VISGIPQRFAPSYQKQIDHRSQPNEEDESKPTSSATSIEDPSLPANNTGALIKRLYQARDHSNITANLEVPVAFGELWGDLVSDYGYLSLSIESDILPALSGIANLMTEYDPGRYIAGLWERDIHYLLGWESVRGEGRCYRPSVYTAPSFSWASRMGPVTFPFECLITRLCKIIDIRCNVSGYDTFGHVQGGYITLQGKHYQARLKATASLEPRTLWFSKILMGMNIRNFNG
jgi:hypothetical protein